MADTADVDIEDVDSLLRKGIAAVKAGERDRAYGILRAIVRRDPQHEEALLWLAWVVDDPSASIMYLELLLSANPHSVAGKRGLEWARARQLQRNQEKGRALYEPAPVRPNQGPAPSQPGAESLRIRKALEVPVVALSGPAGAARATGKARFVAAFLGVLLVGFALYSVLLTRPSTETDPGSTAMVLPGLTAVPAIASRDLSARGGSRPDDPNVHSTGGAVIAQPAGAPSATRPAPSASTPEPLEYVVKQGDSLWAIARQYEVTVDEIVSLNKLPNNNLSIGQKLLIPRK